MVRLSGLAALCALLVLAPTVQAQLPPAYSNTADFNFGTARANTSTGLKAQVGNPTDLGLDAALTGPTPSLEAFTVTMPQGTKINDTIFRNCNLRLPVLLTVVGGANGCPSSSLIGRMELQIFGLGGAPGNLCCHEVQFNLYNTPDAGLVGTFPISNVIPGLPGNYVISGTLRGPSGRSTGPRLNLNSIPPPPPAVVAGAQPFYGGAVVELFPAARGRTDFIVTPPPCNGGGIAGSNWRFSTTILVSGGTKGTDPGLVTCAGPPLR